MSDKGHLLSTTISTFWVEQVSSSHERMLCPEVAINTVHCSGLVPAVNSHSLIQSFLIGSQISIKESEILIFSLDNLNSISINLLDRAHSDSTIFSLVIECPLGGLFPRDGFPHVVLGHQVLIHL